MIFWKEAKIHRSFRRKCRLQTEHTSEEQIKIVFSAYDSRNLVTVSQLIFYLNLATCLVQFSDSYFVLLPTIK